MTVDVLPAATDKYELSEMYLLDLVSRLQVLLVTRIRLSRHACNVQQALAGIHLMYKKFSIIQSCSDGEVDHTNSN